MCKYCEQISDGFATIFEDERQTVLQGKQNGKWYKLIEEKEGIKNGIAIPISACEMCRRLLQ